MDANKRLAWLWLWLGDELPTSWKITTLILGLILAGLSAWLVYSI